jgi:hypothetical protein
MIHSYFKYLNYSNGLNKNAKTSYEEALNAYNDEEL